MRDISDQFFQLTLIQPGWGLRIVKDGILEVRHPKKDSRS
jgi:hypothetical protein